jgi:hypothetical protein
MLAPRSDSSLRWLSRLVAAAAEERLSFSMLGLLGWRGSVEARANRALIFSAWFATFLLF